MVKPVTGAQQRIIEAAEPGTGRLSGTAAQLDGLVRRGLAFRHPRPPHACFLTPAGHRLREGDAPVSPPPPGSWGGGGGGGARGQSVEGAGRGSRAQPGGGRRAG
ncbi:hypothetical protein ACFV5M_26570, partial [Streptomyces albidoflavus]